MKNGVIKKLTAAALVCVLILLFSGCAALKEGRAILDDQMEQIMHSIEANDKAAFAKLAHDAQYAQALFNAFDDLATLWPAETQDTYYNLSLNITTANGESAYQGEYLVRSDGKFYTINISYQQDVEGAGITYLRAELCSNPFSMDLPTGTLATAGKNSLPQWLFLLFWLACVGFSVFTIIDVARKQPQYYGLFFLVALAFVSVSLSFSATNFHLNWSISILGVSRWLQYPNGGHTFVLSLPIGAVAYWCMRKSLLRQKAEKSAQAAYYAQFQPIVPQKQTFHAPVEFASTEPLPEEPNEEYENRILH